MDDARKVYPALKVLLAAAILLTVAAVVLFAQDGNVRLLLTMLGGAVALAFLGLLFPRRAGASPGSRQALAHQPSEQIEEALRGLEGALTRGDITQERYSAATARLRAELARRGKA